jgi:hypothetical protein
LRRSGIRARARARARARSGTNVGGSNATKDKSSDFAGRDGGDDVVLVLGDSVEAALTLQRGKITAAGSRVGYASTAKSGLTSRSAALISDEKSADGSSLLGDRSVNTIKDVALDDGVGPLVGIKGVALHVLEVVVGSVEVTVGAGLTKLGSSASNIVEVVAVKSDLVALTVEHHGPVVVAVARSRSVGDAVKFGVGDGEPGAIVVRDDEHAADLGELAVIDPDTIVETLELESVTTPYNAGVDVGEFDALDNDVLGSLLDRQTLALENSLTVTDDTLVAANREGLRTSSVVGDGANRDIVITSARKITEVKLTTIASTAALAITTSTSLDLSSKVKLLVEVDNTRSVISKKRSKLLSRRRRNSLSLTTSDTSSKTVSLARNTLSRSRGYSRKDGSDTWQTHIE